MKRKVFITGISSEIMTRFVALLNSNEFEIVGLTRNSQATLPEVKMVVGDMLDTASFSEHLEGCDTIIHAAAITHSFSEKNYFAVNLESTKILVDLAKLNKVKNFIFVSSNTAGERSGAYGLSKLRAEEYIKNTLTRWVILRPSEVYGGAKKEGIEELIDNVLMKPIVLCPKDVPTDFYPIHIDDAVRTMYQTSFDPKSKNTTQLIIGQQGYSFLDVIELVKKSSSKNPKIVFLKKSWMYLIRRVARWLPFSIGIIPDQIDRLYAVKEIDAVENKDYTRLEDYVRELVQQDRLIG